MKDNCDKQMFDLHKLQIANSRNSDQGTDLNLFRGLILTIKQSRMEKSRWQKGFHGWKTKLYWLGSVMI